MGMIFYIIFTCDYSVFDPKFNPEIISTRKELITSLEVLNCSPVPVIVTYDTRKQV
jgi:hypothetical protein